MTMETTLATAPSDLNLDKLEKLALNAIKSAFTPFKNRLNIIFDTIKPGFSAARTEISQSPSRIFDSRIAHRPGPTNNQP